MRSSMPLTTYGAHIPAIGSLVPTMPKSSTLTEGFTSLVRVALMRFLRIGLITITGYAPLCVKLLSIWSCAVLKEL